jgi:endonuclease/exonuclease/phosphatase family metal-dependent hydrolase
LPFTGNSNLKKYAVCLAVVFFFSCRSLVTTYEDVESAIYYEDTSQESAEFNDTLKVMTWNIRFGAGRIPFFGDSCGERVLMKEDTTIKYLQGIANYIDTMVIKPDILLFQEVDISSKRSAYVNQLQWLLNNTHFKYAAYASMWDAELIPSDGLGKVDVGNAILSRWKITDAQRIQLPLRTDQDDLTQYFYLRRNILKAKIALPEHDNFYAVNIHATAFATDDTKQKHIAKYKEVLDELHDQGALFITGGDYNSIPTDAEPFDFCTIDQCGDENWHTSVEEKDYHKEGSYFNNFQAFGDYPGERDLLQPFYADSQNYFSAIPYQDRNSEDHFTHCTYNTSEDYRYWDRKLDYLFTNKNNWSSTGNTHQDAFYLSDHAPVSAILIFP